MINQRRSTYPSCEPVQTNRATSFVHITDAIEARNSQLHRAEQTRGYFPGNEAAMKLPYIVSTRRSKNGNGHRASDQKKPDRRHLQRTVHFLTTTTGPTSEEGPVGKEVVRAGRP